MTDSSLSFILEPEAIKILSKYNIPYPQHGLARNTEEAVKIAAGIGYPVVMKIVSREVSHKSDIGGVLVGIKDARQVAEGYQRIVDNLQANQPGVKPEGVLVVQQADEGVEVIAGALDDPTFGATLMFGLGGIFAEILKDVSFRIAPINPRDANEMVHEIKGFPLLSGVRGRKPCDLDALQELLMNLSRLVTENPQIKELDLNPVRVYEKGLFVLDARMLVSMTDQ